MIAIIDYDAGNIKSVEKAIRFLGEETEVTRDISQIMEADGVILPGVGSFGDAMEKLHTYELIEPIRQVAAKKTPFLGICLGLQLLFESSEESPGVQGLGLLPGKILRIPQTPGLKIPQIGWNALRYPESSTPGRLFQGVSQGAYVYFVHSYYLKADQPMQVKAVTDYGTCIHASVESDNLFACQFHPEKSSDVGLQILRNFIEITHQEKERPLCIQNG
jgi:glutamine amidotransferase